MRILIVLTLALLGIAVAQGELPPASFDPAVWFASAAGLGAAIFVAVGFIKEHLWKTLRDWQTIALSFGLGIVGAVIGSFTTYYDATIPEAALFGVSAALIASGGWDGIKAAIRKGAAEAPVKEGINPHVDPPTIPPSERG